VEKLNDLVSFEDLSLVKNWIFSKYNSAKNFEEISGRIRMITQ
jgi:hypothetical protein